MLPDGFHWTPRWQYAEVELALKLDGRTVAQLMRRNTGEWYALLECHWGIREPLVSRPCSSFDAGKAGIETWATRHVDRLRVEVARGGRIRPSDRGSDME